MKEISLYNLPIGWATATIENLIGVNGLFVDGDWIESKDQNPNGRVRLIQLADIGDGTFKDKSNRFISFDRAVEINCTFLQYGDVLVARMPDPLGRAIIFPYKEMEQYVTVVDVAIIRIGDGVYNKWLMYFINSPDIRKKIVSFQTGTTRKRISRSNLAQINIPIPPLNEQYRIVEKIDELFSEIDHVEKSLLDIQKRLDVYWKGILGAVYNIDTFNVKMGEISNITMGQSPPGTTYNNKGIGTPLINGPVEFNKTSFSKTVLSKWTTKPTKTCKEGDIIICVRGSTTGRLNVAGFDACIGRGVAAIEVKKDVLSKYLLYFLHHKEKFILDMGTGTTFPSISKEQLYDLTIPLYSIEEQMDIVDNFDYKYSIVENSKSAIDDNLIQLQRLKQSVLNKAFEGRLVPQNPNDEPAFELLKRIKEERIEYTQSKPKDKKVKIKIEKMEQIKSVLDLLKEAQKPLSVKEVWLQSKHRDSIDDFYAELKSISDLIEQSKSKTEILLSLKK